MDTGQPAHGGLGHTVSALEAVVLWRHILATQAIGNRDERRLHELLSLAAGLGLPAIAARSVAALEQFEAMTRDGLVLSPDTIAAMGRSDRRGRRWETAALWVIALSLLGLLWLSH